MKRKWEWFLMKRVAACLLLACISALLPAAAMPLRLCFIEGIVLPASEEETNCCDPCQREESHGGDCCIDIASLPEGLPPQAPLLPPSGDPLDLPVPDPAPALTPRFEQKRGILFLPDPPAGPPGMLRALFSVWRL